MHRLGELTVEGHMVKIGAKNFKLIGRWPEVEIGVHRIILQ